MSDKVLLTRESFIEQMFRYGYLSEQLPSCFTSRSFAAHWEDVCKIARKASSKGTAPVDFSTFKSGISRRIISVSNPWDFAATVKYMGEHWSEIKKFAENPHSQSPITFISQYIPGDAETVNCVCAREALRARSDYVANIHDRVVVSLGYKYKLSVDVAAFYNSVYTHSITWAICGKDQCKRYFAFKDTPEGKNLKPEKYDFADQLDKLIRNQKRKETSGVLTGPFTSRIFTEILMAGIDKRLIECNSTFVYKRYVDDYKFYFRTEAEARNGIIEIERVLNEYSLSLNQQKIELEEFPFDTLSPMKARLDAALREGGTFALLNEAGIMHSSGEKGAYKYALKMLSDKRVEPGNEEVVLSALFNINLVNPIYTRYIMRFVEKNKNILGVDRLTEIVNDELERSIDDHLEQEVLNYLYFIKELGLSYRKPLLAKAIENGDDFSRVIALDLWSNHKRKAIGNSAPETHKLNVAVSNLASEMHGASMDGEHWLLLYESKVNGLLDCVEFENGATSELFAKMDELGISFYRH